MPEMIDVLQADDLRDVAHRAVACLARGGVVALATDSRYALVTKIADPAVLGRIADWLDAAGTSALSPPRPITLLVKGPGDLADWADLAAIAAARLPSRVWPGPVVLQLRPLAGGLTDRLAPEIRSAVVVDGWLLAQSPADRLTREILRLTSGPLFQVDALAADEDGRSRGLVPLDLGRCDGLEMILNSGAPSQRGRPTVVTIDNAGWSVVRPGVIPERQVEEWAGVIILFVCTGNTCRSPMAEALCKAILSQRIGCALDDLPRQGFVVRSAGVAASDGVPAAANAVEVVRKRGGSLANHASQQITPILVRHADYILAMTWDHLDALLDQAPEAAPRVRLLDPTGEDVLDPVGKDEQTYRDTARVIERHLEHLIAELGL